MAELSSFIRVGGEGGGGGSITAAIVDKFSGTPIEKGDPVYMSKLFNGVTREAGSPAALTWYATHGDSSRGYGTAMVQVQNGNWLFLCPHEYGQSRSWLKLFEISKNDPTKMVEIAKNSAYDSPSLYGSNMFHVGGDIYAIHRSRFVTDFSYVTLFNYATKQFGASFALATTYANSERVNCELFYDEGSEHLVYVHQSNSSSKYVRTYSIDRASLTVSGPVSSIYLSSQHLYPGCRAAGYGQNQSLHATGTAAQVGNRYFVATSGSNVLRYVDVALDGSLSAFQSLAPTDPGSVALEPRGIWHLGNGYIICQATKTPAILHYNANDGTARWITRLTSQTYDQEYSRWFAPTLDKCIYNYQVNGADYATVYANRHYFDFATETLTHQHSTLYSYRSMTQLPNSNYVFSEKKSNAGVGLAAASVVHEQPDTPYNDIEGLSREYLRVSRRPIGYALEDADSSATQVNVAITETSVTSAGSFVTGNEYGFSNDTYIGVSSDVAVKYDDVQPLYFNSNPMTYDSEYSGSIPVIVNGGDGATLNVIGHGTSEIFVNANTHYAFADIYGGLNAFSNSSNNRKCFFPARGVLSITQGSTNNFSAYAGLGNIRYEVNEFASPLRV